jgi:hypothetical protein
MAKQNANWRRCLLGAVLALFLNGLLARSPGQATRSILLFTTNVIEREECEVNLGRIYDAIQEYRRQHQDKLPDRLSDLLPEFISNPNDLLCPFVQRTGDLKSWRERVRYVGGSDPRTSYGYEFCLDPLTINEWRGPPKTHRQKKEAQMKILGRPVVPIIRCLAHRPRLNLAYDGHVYDSAGNWERNFANREEEENLSSTRLFSDRRVRRPVAPEDFPARPPQATSRHLDLTTHYNAQLADSWQGSPGNTLARLPTGFQDFGGVTFDVRGLIQTHVHWLPVGFPKKVEGMNAGQKCRVIHFLHGTALAPGSLTNDLASYRVRYKDGQVHEVPLLYGQHIADWWFDPKTQHGPTEARVVWTGENEAARSYGKSIRLFRFSWDNPVKDVEITSIDLISGNGNEDSAMFLIAITLE